MSIAHSSSFGLQFSTHDIAECDRLGFWRDFFCRKVIQVEVESEDHQLFDAGVSLISCPGLQVMWANTSVPVRLLRTPELVADGADSVAILISRTGSISLCQRQQEVTLGEGEATGLLHTEPAQMMRTPGQWMGLMIPSKALAPFLRDVEETTTQLIPKNSIALGLLISYIELLKDRFECMSAELRNVAVAHIHELIALALGPQRDDAVLAATPGVRAARLQAVKADILQNLTSCELSIGAVAKRQGISPRYVQMMLEDEGTSYSEFVLEQRLLQAYRMISDPCYPVRKITAIVADVGLGDLSYFNRTFRRRFGMTPSEARKTALTADHSLDPVRGARTHDGVWISLQS